MKVKLLNYLACPNCRGRLKINIIDKEEKNEIIEGILTCKCGCNYKIKDGVPRMFYKTTKGVEKASKAFSSEWDQFSYQDDADDTWPGLNEEKRISRFMTAFSIKPKDLKGKVVLDAGCGNGRFSHTLSKLGAEVVGLDISSGVEHAFNVYKSNKVHYIQGDITNIPLKEKSFDYIWSAGVLHHTPDTKKSFEKIVPLAKPGSKVYIWVYGWPSEMKNLRGDFIWNSWKLIINCPKLIQKIIGSFYIYPFAYLQWTKENNSYSLCVKQKRRIFYDYITPYMYKHSIDEVKDWFHNHKFKNVSLKIKDFETFCGFEICGSKS
jgi:SAM-dependent methyltransferase